MEPADPECMDLGPIPVRLDDGSPEGSDYDMPPCHALDLPDWLTRGPRPRTWSTTVRWQFVADMLQRAAAWFGRGRMGHRNPA